MKSMIRLFLVPLVTLVFAGVSFAQATPATPATPAAPEKKMEKADKKMESKAEKPKATSVTGEVSSVDAKAGMLTVKTKDKDVNLTAESKSAKGALEKIKTGDTVKVSYVEKDGKMVANTISKAKGEAKGKDTTMKEEKKADSKKEEPKSKMK